nr:RagB/SusD family nutrient uptake outer membrane protein [uncultured Allomuricauda sp.]
MKKQILNTIIGNRMKRAFISLSLVTFFLIGCEDKFLDLDDLDSLTESQFFDVPEDFEAATNLFYNFMQARGDFQYICDFGTDFNAWTQPYGQGTNTDDGSTDAFWSSGYGNLRDVNIVIEKAAEYAGNASDISEYVAVAYFFRAWEHFTLLRMYGGIPLATKVFEVDDEDFNLPRNSRYEVIEQVLADLDVAIAGLPATATGDDLGRISSYAAEAFKARVLLYEGTWEKYVGTSTDFEGSGGPISTPASFFDRAVTAAKSVIDNGGYEIFNFNTELDNLSYRYLFVLEGADSNPAGLTKADNKEFIIQNIYDFDLRQPGSNLPHTTGGRNAPTQTFLDLFLSTDGLPIAQSPLFQGYFLQSDQFIDRDYRMISYFGENLPENGSLPLPVTGGSVSLSNLTNRKYRVDDYPNYREAGSEGFNYPQLRLAEVLLTYAEALYERDGSISDADLDISINVVRERAGVAPLTNALATANNLDILEEIRRERSVELYMENNRYNDLKRWDIAVDVLGQDLIGAVVEGTEYATDLDLYDPATMAYGTTPYESGDGILEATIIDPAAVRLFSRKNYFFPIPATQLNPDLAPNLVQNPGW